MAMELPYTSLILHLSTSTRLSISFTSHTIRGTGRTKEEDALPGLGGVRPHHLMYTLSWNMPLLPSKRILKLHCSQFAVSPPLDLKYYCIFILANPTLFPSHTPDSIAEVAAVDDGACQFVQDRLRIGSEKEQRLGLQAALGSFAMLWRDNRGNRVLQTLLICGSREMKKELLAAIHREGPLSLSMHKSG